MSTLTEQNIGSETLSEILSPAQAAPQELVIATLKGFDEQSQPLVEYLIDGTLRSKQSISTQALSEQHIGRQVALMFVNGNIDQPIVIGVIRNSLDVAIESFEINTENLSLNDAPVDEDQLDDSAKGEALDEGEEIIVDGKKVVIQAKEELVLKCGSSSITLTKSGKIMLRGKYLVSRSSGVNRILGGSVQVN